MTSVLIICGGTSSEREVSLRSGAAVRAALETHDYVVDWLDAADEITDAQLRAADVVFPLVHGEGGEDGELQERLEGLGVAYVGSDSRASRLCFDKGHYKDLLLESGLPAPDGAIIHDGPLQEHPLVQKPFVLKPYNGGSSVDTFIIRDTQNADFAAMQAALDRHGEMLIEELIAGTEITVGVLGHTSLPVIEIIPPAHEEFDYHNKYNGHTQELCPPVHVSDELQAKARTLAEQLHDLCDCRDYSRSDMIITDDGHIKILETNTIPGMTEQSLFPKMAATDGVTMPELCDQLVQLALARNN